MLDSEPQNEIIESNENNINNEEKSTIVNTLYNHRIITDENMTNLPRKENTERIEKSTIRTDKKVKRKIVVRVTKPKSERIEEEDKIKKIKMILMEFRRKEALLWLKKMENFLLMIKNKNY